MSLSVILSGFGVSMIFGFSFLFTKNALDHVSPMNFLVYRFLVASLVFLFLLSFKVITIEKKELLETVETGSISADTLFHL